ncbi:putative serine/threonine-protein kinase haspin [Folsomia candida]|uniref:non-specific serine/threonine protein kinase n=1 Tax=Folsomia candida TaxID=158441 RepID=A0A226DLD9_FOLCA|nr:putative serine/threonine-protein kinase haspin [Folsomia candida]
MDDQPATEMTDMDPRQREKEFLATCHQEYPIPMNNIFQEIKDIAKIGEGIFGEVYQGNVPLLGEGGHGDTCNVASVVFKIVPIEGEEFVNGERQKKFEEVAPEVVITEKLGKLGENMSEPNVTGGYAKMYYSYLACGEYPANLVTAWNKWHEVNDSDNDAPMFSVDQKFVVFLFEHGGEDAGCYQFKDAKQTFFMIMQIIHMLAVAEIALEFEHRDLHGNNILIKKTHQDFSTFKVNGKVMNVPTCGIIPTIIDFTFSRIKDPGTNAEIFLDMADDEEMFMSTGNYQFDIYRMMRDANRNRWGPFNPKSNIMWLHYLVDKLLSKKHWTETATFDHRVFLGQMHHLKSRLLSFTSCHDFVCSPLLGKYLTMPDPKEYEAASRGRRISVKRDVKK